MFHKSASVAILLCAFICYSCVSSKKYKSASAEIESLNAQNNSLQQQVSDLNSKLSAMNAEFSNYKSTCEEAKQELSAIRISLHEEYTNMIEVEEMITSAVETFEDQGLEVYAADNGRIYVNLSDQLLYKSGSSQLNENGLKALEALSSALNKYPNLQVIVVGHTDNVPFKDGSNTDNLRLSTDRANGVVRALRDKFSVAPERLVSAGQGLYASLEDNSTEAGRAKNRRIEIILNPDLKKLWDYAKDIQ
jgi:chemotaxis protein MotB